MKLNHTPGPWVAEGWVKLRDGGDAPLFIKCGFNGKPYTIAAVSGLPPDEVTSENVRANARLIAASPELFDFLIDALKIMGRYNIDDDGDQVYQRGEVLVKRVTDNS